MSDATRLLRALMLLTIFNSCLGTSSGHWQIPQSLGLAHVIRFSLCRICGLGSPSGNDIQQLWLRLLFAVHIFPRCSESIARQ